MKDHNQVLITGAFGFIGYFLAKKVLEACDKCHVVMMGRTPSDEARELQAKYGNRLKFDTRDIRDMEEDWYPYADQVYHLAARKITTGSVATIDVLEDNLELDLAVFDSFALRPDVKLLYASTGEVYGPLWEKQVIDGAMWPMPEANAICGVAMNDPQWLYAASKIAGEMRLRWSNFQFRTVIARLQNPYGPRMGDATLIPALMKSVIDMRAPNIWANDTRPFLYVDDAVDALMLLMRSDHTNGATVNVCGRELRVEEVAASISKVCSGGKWSWIDQQKPPYRSNHRRALETKMLDQLGWHQWVDIDDGIRRTWEHYKVRFAV